MGLGIGTLAVSFLAGVLSILSPCVLPLLPLVFGAAATAHRWGVAALAGGLVISFVAIGLFVATIGFSIGLDQGVFRIVSAILLALLGAVLVSSALQAQFALATSGFGQAGNRLMAWLAPPDRAGLGGQLALGWSDIGGGLCACFAGPRPRHGCRGDDRVRARHGAASAGDRAHLAAGAHALARPDAADKCRRQGRSRLRRGHRGGDDPDGHGS
jgi:hypothetical protein